MKSARERFEEKIEFIPFHGCWEWMAARCGGGGSYGSFYLEGRQTTATKRRTNTKKRRGGG